jgi:hypothetical protein
MIWTVSPRFFKGKERKRLTLPNPAAPSEGLLSDIVRDLGRFDMDSMAGAPSCLAGRVHSMMRPYRPHEFSGVYIFILSNFRFEGRCSPFGLFLDPGRLWKNHDEVFFKDFYRADRSRPIHEDI